MDRTKRYFISDVHLGMGRDFDWYQRSRHEVHLVAALDRVASDLEAKDLVLLGDIFDTWMSPPDEAPPTAADIILHGNHGQVWAALARAAANVDNVFYLNGNHDMQTTQSDLDLLRQTADLPKPITWITKYQAGLLYAEHGSRFAMFNAPDRLHDPADGLPLGYFITRILAGDSSYLSPAAVAQYVDDLLEAAFTTQTIASSVIEALMERKGLKADTQVQMQGGRSITLGEVKIKYAALFDRWVEKFGYLYALNAIRGEMNSLGWFADRLCRSDGYKVVVLGHTHDAMADADGFFRTYQVYANSGYFCCDAPTFVEVDKDAGGFAVKIWKVDSATNTFAVAKDQSVT